MVPPLHALTLGSPLLTLTPSFPSPYLIVLEAMCGLMEETDANCRHRSNIEALASRALQRREVREGPSEYLFDWGTHGTAIYMYRVITPRPVTLAASTWALLSLAVFEVYHLLITSHF